MRRFMFVIVSIMLLHTVKASTDTTGKKLYNPKANATLDIQNAIAQAKKEHKNVFIQLGGNWCHWCLQFNKVVTTDPHLDSLLKANYIVYHLNYSPENKNVAIMEKLKYPNRFGFPCFIILDENGEELHIQNSAYLEQGKGYDKKKITNFFNNWTTKSLQPKSYPYLYK